MSGRRTMYSGPLQQLHLELKDNKDLFDASDEWDRVVAIQQQPAFRNFPLEETATIKDLPLALRLKEDGNQLFKTKRFSAAREAYTKSLLYFPVNYNAPLENAEFAITLANRSAALDALGFYSGVVQDVDMALKYGYPKNLHFKVYSRKGQALLRLGQLKSAKETYVQCVDVLSKSDLPSNQRDQFLARTMKHMSAFKAMKALRDEPQQPGLVLLDGESPSLPASSARLVWDGAVVRTAKGVPPEAVLLREAPLCAIPLPSAESQHCPVSLRSLVAPVPCSFGVEQLFSDEKARDVANATFHRFEWRWDAALKRAGLTSLGRLALRTVTRLSPEAVADGRMEDSITPLGLEEESGTETSLLTAFFLHFLRKARFFGERHGPALTKAEQNAVVLLHRVIGLVRRYALSITSLALPSLPGHWDSPDFPSVEYAVGLFPTYSRLASISGDGGPSRTIAAFVGATLIVQTTDSIEEGQPVCVRNSFEARRGVANDHTDLITFKCSNALCPAGFPLKENTSEIVIRCPLESCGQETNIWLLLTTIQDLKNRHVLSRRLLAEGKVKEAEMELAHLIEEWDKIVFRPYKELSLLDRELQWYRLLCHSQDDLLVQTPRHSLRAMQPNF